MKRKYVFLVAALLLVSPILVSAAGLVPCGSPGQEACQTCHAVELLNRVAAWLVAILSIVLTIVIVVSGLRLATSTGNVSTKESAKRMIINATVGFIIVLAAWLMIDLGMKMLLSGGSGNIAAGPWNVVRCEVQPRSIVHPVPNASRGTAQGNTVTLADGTVIPIVNASGVVDPVALQRLAELGAPDDIVAAAAANNGLTPDQARNLQALMRVESGGCTNMVSPVGALGCMQIMPGTARAYDPSLRGLSDAEVRDRLLNDNAYNINLSTIIYRDLDQRFGGDETLIYAAYNGGPGANNPSANCPGQRRWQCEWDGSDCINGVGSDCTPNTGYIETRNYVQRVDGVRALLD